jgi:hypothetical protein
MRTRFTWGTFKLVAVITMVALTTNTFGQQSEEERLFSMNNNEFAFYTEGYISDDARIENCSTETFESIILEEKLYLESWMIESFESGIIEEELWIESWMMVPFEPDEEIEVEYWMTDAWI